jgi:hypothetical protein
MVLVCFSNMCLVCSGPSVLSYTSSSDDEQERDACDPADILSDRTLLWWQSDDIPQTGAISRLGCQSSIAAAMILILMRSWRLGVGL